MADPTTALPAAKAMAEDERSVLQGYLDYHRVVLARKAEGLTEQQARLAACPPSDLTLLGLIRHMTDVERHWFREVLAGEEPSSVYGPDETEFRPPVAMTLTKALSAYWDEISVCNRTIEATSLDEVTKGGTTTGQHSLRRTIVHMIEEYARHCGHADLLREAIDGRTGD